MSGETVEINGRRFRRPISFWEWLDICEEPDYDPKNKPKMWYVDLSKNDELVSSDVEPEQKFFHRGLVHRNKEDAVEHASALLSFTEGDTDE